MEHVKLAVSSRAGGKVVANRLRKEGKIPAILYGKKIKPQPIAVPSKELAKALSTSAGFNTLFDLSVDEKQTLLARVCEHEIHPIRRDFVHVDFQAVDVTEKVTVEVPIHIVGNAPGVKEGGVLEFKRRVLELRCLVTQIPQHIEINVEGMNIGDNIHANDVKLPAGVEFPHDTNFPVVSVVPPKKEEEAVVAPEAAISAADVPSTAQKLPEEGAVEEGKDKGGKEKSKDKEKEGKK